MILNTMTPAEITSEILNDFNISVKSWERLCNEYDRERKKLKIEKDLAYHKIFKIKSHKKNVWVFILSKAPSHEKYRSADSINVLSYTYLFTPSGLRVFKVVPTGGLAVYNGHLFNRYYERMGLPPAEPVQMVNTFFINNGYSTAKAKLVDGKSFVLGVCKDGFILGELQNNNQWIVYKTFITRNQSGGDQDGIELNLLNGLQDQIEKQLNEDDFDRLSYELNVDVAKGVSPNSL